MRAKNIKRNENFDRANSTLQTEINKLQKVCNLYRAALIRRKNMVRLNSDFISKLKVEGRVTIEELKEHFTIKK